MRSVPVHFVFCARTKVHRVHALMSAQVTCAASGKYKYIGWKMIFGYSGCSRPTSTPVKPANTAAVDVEDKKTSKFFGRKRIWRKGSREVSANSGIANNNNKVNRSMTVVDNSGVPGNGDTTSWDGMVSAPTTTSTTPAGIAPPPPTQINKLQLGAPVIRKDKRRSSSRFNISSNRELNKLPYLKVSSSHSDDDGGGGGDGGDGVVVVDDFVFAIVFVGFGACRISRRKCSGVGDSCVRVAFASCPSLLHGVLSGHGIKAAPVCSTTFTVSISASSHPVADSGFGCAQFSCNDHGILRSAARLLVPVVKMASSSVQTMKRCQLAEFGGRPSCSLVRRLSDGHQCSSFFDLSNALNRFIAGATSRLLSIQLYFESTEVRVLRLSAREASSSYHCLSYLGLRSLHQQHYVAS
ncbi:hypothetical protein V9T40_002980 [Parthenolecanium corni]|uniref:Uncharacterized protein n=1 Tax=Parthenolecanium corni TaxID=536013 RepID=A0AAN9TRP2_9HEMI